MDMTWQDLVFAALLIAWGGGAACLYLLFLRRQRAYLRNFPPAEGIPLDTFRGGNPLGARSRASFRAMQALQSDADLEQMRRDLWRRWRYVVMWIFGFPVLCIITAFVILVIVRVSRIV